MLEYELLSFEINSQKHLFDVLIVSSFTFPNVLFQIHETAPNKIKVFWRENSSSHTLFNVINKVKEIFPESTSMNISEISKTDCFKEAMSVDNPIKEIELTPAEMRTVLDFYDNGIPINATTHRGYDGHTFYITMFGNQIKEYEF